MEMKKLLTFYFAILLFKSIFILMYLHLDLEPPNHDFWFEKYTINLLYSNEAKINWNNQGNYDGYTNNPPQQGIYYNWRPIGYSVFLIPPIYSGLENIDVFRTIYQLLIYSLIPIIFYFIVSFYFSDNNISNIFMIIITGLFLINPQFLISSLQSLDTWFITLFVLLSFYLLLRIIKDSKTQNYILYGISVSLLFFIKPNILIPFIFVLFFAYKHENKVTINKPLISLTIILLTVFSWGIRNYNCFNVLDFTNSSLGYNLWLGNNKYTNSFLKEHLGDGSTIEDNIVPKFNEHWKFLSKYNEYEKNNFFLTEALKFIKNNPVETIDNMFLKFIGFWSPLRVRGVHWSDSALKKYIILLYSGSLLLLSFFSILQYVYYKEYKDKSLKTILIIFMFLWMLPHLMFFSTARFRTPIDFGLVILSADFIIMRIKKITFLGRLLYGK